MNPIAVYSGNTVLYWSSIVICVGLLASLFRSLPLFRSLLQSLFRILNRSYIIRGQRASVSCIPGNYYTALAEVSVNAYPVHIAGFGSKDYSEIIGIITQRSLCIIVGPERESRFFINDRLRVAFCYGVNGIIA